MTKPSKKTFQRLALFLAMPLSLLVTIPFSQVTVHGLQQAMRGQTAPMSEEDRNPHLGRVTREMVEVLILPFAARNHRE